MPAPRPPRPAVPAVALIGLLVIALAYVTVYVLTSNTIKDRKAKIAAVQTQVTAAQAAATRLTNYVNFTKLAANRDATVRQIATQRFDWHAALSDLSKVVPANTSLQSLLGTVSPSRLGQRLRRQRRRLGERHRDAAQRDHRAGV